MTRDRNILANDEALFRMKLCFALTRTGAGTTIARRLKGFRKRNSVQWDRMMHSAVTNGTTKDRWNSSDTGPTFGSTKLATAAIRGTLTLAMLSALLLIAARPMD